MGSKIFSVIKENVDIAKIYGKAILFLFFCLICFLYSLHTYFYYPISTLPEHLHSIFPSYAKIPENTLTEKKKFLFPL